MIWLVLFVFITGILTGAMMYVILITIQDIRNPDPLYVGYGQWHSVTDEPQLQEGDRVIGYFPTGDENGRSIAPAIYTNEKLIPDTLSSTAAWFRASHWMSYPDEPEVQVQ